MKLFTMMFLLLVFCNHVLAATEGGGGGIIVIDKTSKEPVYVSMSSHLNSIYQPISSTKFADDFGVLHKDLVKFIKELPISKEHKKKLIESTEIIPLERDYYLYSDNNEDLQFQLKTSEKLFNHYLCAGNYPTNFNGSNYGLSLGAITIGKKTFLTEDFFKLGSSLSTEEEKLQKLSLLFLESLRVLYPKTSTCFLEEIQISFENYFRYDKKTKFTKKLARLEDESWSSDVNSNLDALRSQFLQGLSIELTYFNQNMNSNCFQFDYFKVGQLKSLVCKLSQFSKMMNATESFLFTNTYNERYFDLWYLAKNNEEFRHYSVSSLKRFIQFFDASYAVLPGSIFKKRYEEWFKPQAQKLFLALDFAKRNGFVNDKLNYMRHIRVSKKVKSAKPAFWVFSQNNRYVNAHKEVKDINGVLSKYYAWWIRRSIDGSFNVLADFFTKYLLELDPEFIECVNDTKKQNADERYSCHLLSKN